MDKIQKTRAEIERLLNKVWKWHSSTEAKYRCEVYRELLEFIDSLSEETVSEDLEEAASECYYHNQAYARESFVEGANWQKQKTIDKAVEWIYQQQLSVPNIDEFISGFKKYMQGRKNDNLKNDES